MLAFADAILFLVVYIERIIFTFSKHTNKNIDSNKNNNGQAYIDHTESSRSAW